MAVISNEISSIIDQYIKLLNENNFPIEKAFIFGSYSRGKNHQYSDLDLALVSPAFEGNRIKDKNKIRAFTLSVSSMLEVMPFTPKDFSVENPFAKEIIENGIRVV